ncbi:glutamate--tRNA ligase [Thermodesulfovibrio yellowstonii]|uniref:Glutamate--tRNA ligase n=1 Tax=Thermodesulfovibrio yellowstonii (strain ATCC 51303 / DSM 11347 / YP87) TaxID=289376 RepID=SYE_THEYD|nr:glutamate--tRNA ligase [Thermodesulfovibrio yellowstonii]B5YIG1.1 RecName: Full=Glutamate--tRNA ligase; AltName: Full=Glutamyl-tRNA synthetase; Short=GluRS [Thermodesulfovibrio yellowstonii DSM 11347]ACI20684.1 glutamyl-tRNA synthetase [Thermodesulfovibrio yellowstonii DSM 11347]MDI6864486.1 glutamate--tRNA ligase [Thermodesulfovibrio yellowstonii]
MVRVRFAPSPTGHLHIGGARTALFNWLFARHHNGKFILRIEDTDRSRSTEEYIESIIEAMKWLGLDWDEGPFRQTDRMEVYKAYAYKLLEEGKAYRCYCTPEELEERRQQAMKEGKPPRYDRRCREIKETLNKPFAIRFKMPLEGETVVDDLVKGKVTFKNSEIEDLVILRSDGTPTYNFCVVVDDFEMGITHVIRGEDHLNNTPKQIHIYHALGMNPPEFAHIPMILGTDRARLSKRHGATSVLSYRDEGYLSDALVNFLARLGWSYGDKEIFTREELIKYFNLEQVGKANAVFNAEKLLWLNSEYIKLTPEEKLFELVKPFLIKEGYLKEGETLDKDWACRAIKSLKERCRTLKELAHAMRYYLLDYVEIEPKAKEKYINAETVPVLREVTEKLAALEEFTQERIEKIFMDIVNEKGLKLGQVAQPVRVVMTGSTVSPGIYEVLEIAGKEKTLKRLRRVIDAS